MSNRRSPAALKSLLLGARLEVLPSGDIMERVHEHVEAGRTITVTASPTNGLDATLEVTEQLAQRYRVVPPNCWFAPMTPPSRQRRSRC